MGLTALSAPGLGISDLTGLEYCIDLIILSLANNQISDISALAGLTNLDLFLNQIIDITALAGLTNLVTLDLAGNAIIDIGPLVANTGIGSGDFVFLEENFVSCPSILIHIPTLVARGADVSWDDDPSCDIDTDLDGQPDSIDNCPEVQNVDQTNTGGDVMGNACDDDDDNDGLSDGDELNVHSTDPLDTPTRTATNSMTARKSPQARTRTFPAPFRRWRLFLRSVAGDAQWRLLGSLLRRSGLFEGAEAG